MTTTDADLTASDVTWNLETLLGESSSVDALLDEAKALAAELESERGKIGSMDAASLASMMTKLGQLNEVTSRAGHYGMLKFSENMGDPERAAQMQHIQEEATAISSGLVFIELEVAAADDDQFNSVLKDKRLDFCRHYLENVRRTRPYMLSESEEKILIETSVSGSNSWVRLFSEQTSAIEVDSPLGDDGTVSLEEGLAGLQNSDREVRAKASEVVTKGLEPGLRTRAFIYNTLLVDKSIDDRLRGFDTWLSSRNLSNEATDESVSALVDAVVSRYDIPQRWYRLKAKVLSIDKLADYDRMAPIAPSESKVGWAEATEIVRDAYSSFSPELAGVIGEFIDEGWIDAPIRPGKQPGAFCAYTVPSHHPYVLLNWTGQHRDVLTLAHELGHGAHAYLSRKQGVFHHSTPLTLAETASVFGETVTNKRLVSQVSDPLAKFSLLASTIDDSIATVFRQVAMNRFEGLCHNARRDTGEISVDGLNEFWMQSQREMVADSVELTENYSSWWSYIPHFIGTPGYVYAYAYGQLLSLSVYAQYEKTGDSFVPAYLELLGAGGSMSPEDLASIVNCDLADPSFWVSGLEIVDRQLTEAEAAAKLL